MALITQTPKRFGFLPNFSEDEDEDIFQAGAGIPQPRRFTGGLQQPKDVFAGPPPGTGGEQRRTSRALTEGVKETPTEEEIKTGPDGQPETRTGIVTAAVIGAVAAAASTAAAAGSAASAAEAEEQTAEKARAESKRQFDLRLKEEQRAQNLKGLEFLERGRERAVAAGRQRSNFGSDLLKAMNLRGAGG